MLSIQQPLASRTSGKPILSAFAVILTLFLSMVSTESQARYTISLFGNGTFCTSTFPSAYQAGSFSISESTINNNNGFTKGQTNKTLILGFNGGSFQFNPGVGTVTVSGSGVTIVSYSITATTITVTITTTSTNTVINTINFNNIEVRATAAGTGKIVRTGGNFLIDNRTSRPRNTTSWGALTTSTPITYSSSTAAQTLVSSVFSGSTNNQILKLQVVVTGTCGNLLVTQFNLNTIGSTNAPVDIANAKIYYTGTTNSFSSTTLFGTQVAPSGAFSITGSASLSTAGTYYFWLTYDVAALGVSINGDLLDAQFTSVVVGGSTKAPTTSNPAGSRTISNNIYYSINPGLWNNTTNVWSKTSGGLACSCAPTLGNGWVFVNHPVSLNLSITVDIVTIQTGGILTNTAGSVLTTAISLNTTGNGNFTISNNAWTVNDLNLLGTGTSKSSVTQSLGGDIDISSAATFQMTAASGTTFTVNGDINVNGTLSLSGNNMTSSNASGILLAGSGSITGTGTITLGVSKSITAISNISIAPLVSVSGGATITNQGTVNMTNNIAGTGTWLNDVDANLNMGGTTSSITISTLTATAADNTVSYNGSGAQTIKGTTYENLLAGGSGTKSLGAATAVNNTVTINGSAQLSTAALGLSVDNQWINNSSNATPFSSTGTVTFTGSCSITGSAANTFNHLNISSTGFLLSHPTNGSMVILGNWTNDGDFDNNSADVTFSGTSTISGASVTSFGDVIVSSTKTLILPAGGEVDIEGDLTNNGTLTPSTSLIMFVGDGVTQNIKGSAASNAFYQLGIDNTGGSIQLQKPAIITNAITLTNGLITTSSSNSLTLNNGVTIAGGSSFSFINGPLVHVSTGNNVVKVFPIGKSSDYRPLTLTITASGNPTSNYTAEQFNASTSILGYTLPGGIDRASGIHYWILSQSNATGFTNGKVQLSYDVDDQVSDPTHLVVLKNIGVGTTWFNAGGTGTGSPAGTITSNAWTTFGTFTFGNSGSNSLPVQLVRFNAIANSESVDLQWETASEVNNDHFSIERTQDGKKFEEITRVKGAGTSNVAHSYSAVDSNPYTGISYYRLKQTDFDGAFVYSELVMVTFSGKVDFALYPNPVTGSTINIRFNGNAQDKILVTIRDLAGNAVYAEVFTLQFEGELIAITKTDQFSPGIYIVNASNSKESNYRRIVIP